MPPVTQSLLIANVLVFLLQTQTGDQLDVWFALWPPGAGFAQVPEGRSNTGPSAGKP